MHTVNNTEHIIRKLAKTHKYQTLFSASKEGSLTLFENRADYTANQILLLSYLIFYSNLYTDVAMDYVDERVLDNFEYEDAYMYYKRKTKGKIEKEPVVADPNKFNKGKSDSITNTSTWVFKSKGQKKVK